MQHRTEDHLLDGGGDMLQDLAAVLGVPCNDRRWNAAELVLGAEAVSTCIVGRGLGLARGLGQGKWACAIDLKGHEHRAGGQVGWGDARSSRIRQDLQRTVCGHLTSNDCWRNKWAQVLYIDICKAEIICKNGMLQSLLGKAGLQIECMESTFAPGNDSNDETLQTRDPHASGCGHRQDHRMDGEPLRRCNSAI